MSVEMYVVTPSIRLDGMNASVIHLMRCHEPIVAGFGGASSRGLRKPSVARRAHRRPPDTRTRHIPPPRHGPAAEDPGLVRSPWGTRATRANSRRCSQRKENTGRPTLAAASERTTTAGLVRSSTTPPSAARRRVRAPQAATRPAARQPVERARSSPAKRRWRRQRWRDTTSGPISATPVGSTRVPPDIQPAERPGRTPRRCSRPSVSRPA